MNDQKVLSIVNERTGIKFNVRKVEVGDHYGKNNCLEFKNEDGEGITGVAGEYLVEFYDSRYPHSEYGQFVSRYFVSTLKEYNKKDGAITGIDLYGGVGDWFVTDQNMVDVFKWLGEI